MLCSQLGGGREWRSRRNGGGAVVLSQSNWKLSGSLPRPARMVSSASQISASGLARSFGRSIYPLHSQFHLFRVPFQTSLSFLFLSTYSFPTDMIIVGGRKGLSSRKGQCLPPLLHDPRINFVASQLERLKMSQIFMSGPSHDGSVLYCRLQHLPTTYEISKPDERWQMTA